MNAAIGQPQDMATAGNQEHMNLKEESNMKTKNQISKRINVNTTVKMVAGLALGAMLMTAIALPSNAFADTPKRPMTSEEQLVIMAEIEDGFFDTVSLTPEQLLVVRAEIEDSTFEAVSLSPEQQLVVRAEIEDGAYETVSLTGEQQLMVRAEIEDGAYESVSLTSEQQLMVRAEIEDGDFGTVSLTSEQQLMVRAEIEDGVYDTGFLTPEQQLVVRAEIEDGFGGMVSYPGRQVDLSQAGGERSVLQALQSHDVGSVFLAEEWLQIIAEIEDAVLVVAAGQANRGNWK